MDNANGSNGFKESGDVNDRCTGLILGLAAGDRNGGPIQMGLRLAESIIKQQQYKPVEVFIEYSDWYNNGKGIDAWDTGPTSKQLLQAHLLSKRNSKKSSDNDNTSIEILENRSMKLDETLKGMTAGVNAAHRVAPLALAWGLNESQLIEASRQESRLTHWSLISQNTCVVIVILLRKLLQGDDFFNAIDNILSREDELCPQTPIIMFKIKEGLNCTRLDNNGDIKGGFCPEVLKATFHFLSHYDNFEDTLELSVGFAGPSNYCPVLVGTIAGARYGASNISSQQLSHCKPGVNARCLDVGSKMSPM